MSITCVPTNMSAYLPQPPHSAEDPTGASSLDHMTFFAGAKSRVEGMRDEDHVVYMGDKKENKKWDYTWLIVLCGNLKSGTHDKVIQKLIRQPKSATSESPTLAAKHTWKAKEKVILPTYTLANQFWLIQSPLACLNSGDVGQLVLDMEEDEQQELA
ncbi:hypothetical protein BJV74DRAFT_799760 [Russula compacta]|nr:hypothetical protein BJV74DRAFT_799760 [Russula compacta]